jgi:hypothetical protein
MMLVMRQADTIHEMRKHELECLDQERGREAIYVYTFPTQDNPSLLTVVAYNRGEYVAKITRLWISMRTSVNEPIELDSTVSSMSEVNLGSYGVTQEGNYYIKVTTDRGNVFESDSNPLHYQGGTWGVDLLLINVLIYSSQGVLTVECIKTWDLLDVVGSPATVQKGASGTAFCSFDVSFYDIPGENEVYHVSVKKGVTVIHEEDVTVKWPSGPSTVWVFA